MENTEKFNELVAEKIKLLEEEIEKLKELGENEEDIGLYEHTKKVFEMILNEPVQFQYENDEELDEEMQENLLSEDKKDKFGN